MREFRLAVDQRHVLRDVCDGFEVVADGGVGPVPGAPVELLVDGLEVCSLFLGVEERVVSVVVGTAVVVRWVWVDCVCGAGPAAGVCCSFLGLCVNVMERGEAMAVAAAEVAEGFLVCKVHLHVDALAVAVHVGGGGDDGVAIVGIGGENYLLYCFDLTHSFNNILVLEFFQNASTIL